MGAYVQISDRYTTNNKDTYYKGYATKMLDLIEDRVSHFVVLILFTGFSTNQNVLIWFNVLCNLLNLLYLNYLIASLCTIHQTIIYNSIHELEVSKLHTVPNVY